MTIRRSALERVGPFEVALEHGGDEQEWQDRLRAEEPVPGFCTWPARRSSTAVPARTRGCDRSRVPPMRVGAPAAASTAFAVRRLRVERAAHARRMRRACAPPPLPRRAGDGRAQRRAPAREPARRSPTARRPLVPATRSPPSLLDEWRSVQWDGVHARKRKRRLPVRRERHRRWRRCHPPPRAGRGGECLGAGQRPAPAPGPRRAPRPTPAEGARARRRAPRARCAGAEDPPRAAALTPRGRAAHRPAGRARQVREPQPACSQAGWRIVRSRTTTGCCSSTTTSCCPAASSIDFLFLAERFALDLAQPAHRLSSHAAWSLTRRRPFSVVRETPFVEIGPVTAFSARTFSTLLPFPDAAHGLGPGRPLGGARTRAALALRRARRRLDPPSRGARGRPPTRARRRSPRRARSSPSGRT